MKKPTTSPRTPRLALASLLAILPGCMTAVSQDSWLAGSRSSSSVEPAAVVYGGTRAHGSLLASAWSHDSAIDNVAYTLFEIFDLPLSFVADTVLLPITVLERVGTDAPDRR